MTSDAELQPGDNQQGGNVQQVDVCYRVAERAWNRFRNRQVFEWRYAFALWTLFAAGAAMVVVVGDFVLGGWAAFGFALANFLFAIVILWLYRLWLGHLDKHCTQDRDVSKHYEDEMIRLSGLPPNPYPPQLEEEEEEEEEEEDKHPVSRWHFLMVCSHPVSTWHFWMAVSLAVLFVMSPVARYFRGSRPTESRIMIEQGSLEIDGTSKLTLGE